jgi:hypothetical protein
MNLKEIVDIVISSTADKMAVTKTPLLKTRRSIAK